MSSEFWSSGDSIPNSRKRPRGAFARFWGRILPPLREVPTPARQSCLFPLFIDELAIPYAVAQASARAMSAGTILPSLTVGLPHRFRRVAMAPWRRAVAEARFARFRDGRRIPVALAIGETIRFAKNAERGVVCRVHNSGDARLIWIRNSGDARLIWIREFGIRSLDYASVPNPGSRTIARVSGERAARCLTNRSGRPPCSLRRP